MVVASGTAEAFMRGLALPLLVFGPDLRLASFNAAASQVLENVPLEDRLHIRYFLRQKWTDDSEGGVYGDQDMSDVRARLDGLVDEGRQLTNTDANNWGAGSKVQIWTGTKGRRICRWYEALFQTITPDTLASSDQASSSSAPTLKPTYTSILLLRRLVSNLIPSASSIVSAAGPGSVRSASMLSGSSGSASGSRTDEERKHREQDNDLRHILKRVVLTPIDELERLRDVVDHIPHVGVLLTYAGALA